MRTFVVGIVLLAAGLTACTARLSPGAALDAFSWYAGSANCDAAEAAPIEVFRHDAGSYVLRQNKCVHYEAPFMYLFMGDDRAVLLDTGATASTAEFPLAATVFELLAEFYGERPAPLLVMHSHSHSDHVAADAQFVTRPATRVVAPELEALTRELGLVKWPDQPALLDLGGRLITLIPTPGHQSEAITVYDSATGWLLTGDSVYPGRLYVRQWDHYRASIARLASFVAKHEVAAVLGAHIEMDTNGNEYPTGSTFQPDEMSLVLSVKDLQALDQTLRAMAVPEKIRVSDRLVIVPVD